MKVEASLAPPLELKGRTKAYALSVIKLFGKLERSSVGRVLGRQLLRSGTSVGANYREAVRARSDAEFVAKLGDSLKELEECSYWLELCLDSRSVAAADIDPILNETDQLIAIFTTISKKVKTRITSPR